MDRMLQPCKHCGCPELTRNKGGYCDKHIREYTDKLKQQDRRRGTAQERGYDSTWAKVRAMYLSKNPLCENCLSKDKVVPATVVHHKIPIEEGGERLNIRNLQALCRNCHEIHHGRKRKD